MMEGRGGEGRGGEKGGGKKGGGEGSLGTALASEPPSATHELAHLELKEPTVTTIDYCLGAL